MGSILPSRLRAKENLRNMVSETALNRNGLVWPFFVKTEGRPEEVHGKGIARVPLGDVEAFVEPLYELGLRSALLFGVPQRKDGAGSGAFDGPVQQAAARLKRCFPGLNVITDVCLCHYTDHGHCGIVEEGRINRGKTLEALSKVAVSHAEAGADVVAPSAMADGQVGALRRALDAAGFEETCIMAYSAKYASTLYAPFREAAGSSPAFGDRSAYQMDFRNGREGILEGELDLEEGADILMVKPAMPYLDVIKEFRERFTRPIAAYQVSGEYVMIKEYCRATGTDEAKVALEMLTCIRRAGAKIIMSYFVPEILKTLERWP
jgi:porphobilinogen synthase